MSARHLGLLILALSLSVVVGCFREKPAPRAVPSTKRTEEPKPEPKPAPKPPEPVPEGPVQLTPPEDGGVWPWPVGSAPVTTATKPVSFANLPPFAVTGFAIRPEMNRAVVSIKVEGKDAKKVQSANTRIAFCDIATGKVLTEWVMPGQYAVIDLSPDGRQILATSPNQGRERNTLRLWLIAGDGQLKRFTCTPHDVPKNGPPRTEAGSKLTAVEAVEIKWAGFVGNDRVVSSSRAGQLRVFDTEGLKPLATVDASPGRPAVTPDGSKIAFLAGNTVALLDPLTATVIGSRWIGPPPPYPALAFSPDGTKLAIGGNGKLAILNLATGDVRLSMLTKLRVTDNGVFDKPIGWAGNEHLFADGQLLDPQFPLPLWDYSGAEHIRFSGNRVWACVRPQGGSTSTIRAFALPHPAALEHIASAKKRDGMLALQPGDGIRIDVSGLPANRHSEAKSALEVRIEEIGFESDDESEFVLLASEDTHGTKASTSYVSGGVIAHSKRPARLRLMHNGKELWSEAWSMEPPFFTPIPEDIPLSDYILKYNVGEPNYKLFSLAPLPATFPGPQAAVTTFGSTELTAEGLKDRQIR